MDEEDETPSRPSLALVVSSSASGRRSGRGGGWRDDCWSEEATAILIDAWGEKFLLLKRGNLKQQHWKEVAEIVNRDYKTKSFKTDIQCKNRIDTVKKKFKQEKATIAANGDYNSKWVFFSKLQRLIGEATTSATTASKALKVTPLSSRSNRFKRQAKSSSTAVNRSSGDSTRWRFRKRVASETESESEPDLSVGSDQSLPPLLLPPAVNLDKTGSEGGKELREVAMAILGFVKSYEKAETVKLKQMVELEKERMKFVKELELQRMQFVKAQLEILRNSHKDRDGKRRRRIRSRHCNKDNDNVSYNS